MFCLRSRTKIQYFIWAKLSTGQSQLWLILLAYHASISFLCNLVNVRTRAESHEQHWVLLGQFPEHSLSFQVGHHTTYCAWLSWYHHDIDKLCICTLALAASGVWLAPVLLPLDLQDCMHTATGSSTFCLCKSQWVTYYFGSLFALQIAPSFIWYGTA